ncbi:hypothetical protein BMS3Abin04_02234 [bacterium BMS3Abin04]|nr:hypothetical protein BMS3Abin04_02234 [bacterium BMS3Abin04]
MLLIYSFNMKRIYILVLFFIYCNSFASGFKLSLKYDRGFNNKGYEFYHYVNIEGLFSIHNNMFEVGFLLGDINTTFTDFKWSDGKEVEKTILGISSYYFPLYKLKTEIKPFIGIKAGYLSRRLFPGVGGRFVSTPGYYFPFTKNDKALILSIGSKYSIENFNIILELEYQYRTFILQYDEYYFDKKTSFLTSVRHTMEKTVNSFLWSIGLQYEL